MGPSSTYYTGWTSNPYIWKFLIPLHCLVNTMGLVVIVVSSLNRVVHLPGQCSLLLRRVSAPPAVRDSTVPNGVKANVRQIHQALNKSKFFKCLVYLVVRVLYPSALIGYEKVFWIFFAFPFNKQRARMGNVQVYYLFKESGNANCSANSSVFCVPKRDSRQTLRSRPDLSVGIQPNASCSLTPLIFALTSSKRVWDAVLSN